MITQGRITIDLGANGGVCVRSNRSAAISRVFEGRKPDAVLQMLPMLFSLCARAHVAAARQALAEAVGAASWRADALGVLAENAREHLLRILLGWRVGQGVDAANAANAANAALAAMAMAFVGKVNSAQTHKAERAAAGELARLLKDNILGIAPEEFLAIRDTNAFDNWRRHSDALAPRHLSRIIDQGWQALGAAPVQALPDMAEDELFARMHERDFTARPDWRGQPCETGPLARYGSHPLVATVIAENGAGLLARLIARLVALAEIPDEMCGPIARPITTPGLGMVETARGRLIHAARIDAGKVKTYRILAPTEWNFHPQGTAVRSLRQLAPGGEIARHARAVVEAIDPCVEFEVRAA